MAASFNRKQLKFEAPGTYRIRVQGILSQNWSDRLGGMAISVSETEEQAPQTTLTGTLADQAALVGVLNTLYDLHLPVLSVDCIKTLSE
jgi:hypothetical protein